MIPDPTDEIRAIRNRLSSACNYELAKIFEETRRHQAESGRAYINLPSRRPAFEDTTNQTLEASGEAGPVDGQESSVVTE